MIVYCWDRMSNEYIGVDKADPDPLDKGRWIIPANASAEKPPTAGALQVVVRSGASWAVVDDYRGVLVWDKTTGERVEIVDYGPLPSGYTLENPGATPYPTWENEQWIGDKDQARDIKKQAIKDFETTQRVTLFPHTHREQAYDFYADRDSIVGTALRCMLSLIVDPDAGSDPVPTPAPVTGHWKTAEFAEDGVTPLLVPMTISEFLLMGISFYDADAVDWGKGQIFMQVVDDMYQDPNVTAADIMAYNDFITNWEV